MVLKRKTKNVCGIFKMPVTLKKLNKQILQSFQKL